jgi:hypothetical protein
MTRKLRLRKADRVRLRLLSERDRDRVVSIADEREQSVSTVLRLLGGRFGGNLDAYEAALEADNERATAALLREYFGREEQRSHDDETNG